MKFVDAIAKFIEKSCPKIWQVKKKSIPLQRFWERDGRLAQLVQSICLTSRGSAVRIRQRPPKNEALHTMMQGFFVSVSFPS